MIAPMKQFRVKPCERLDTFVPRDIAWEVTAVKRLKVVEVDAPNPCSECGGIREGANLRPQFM